MKHDDDIHADMTPSTLSSVLFLSGFQQIIRFFHVGGISMVYFIIALVLLGLLFLIKKSTNRSRNSRGSVVKAAAASAKAGGNVGYIAQNVATIYHCVCKYADKENRYTTAQRIYASLLIDSVAYLQSGKIDPEELVSSVRSAMTYQFGSNHFYSQRVYDPFSDHPDSASLICATADLEVLMFCAEARIDYHTVIDHVMSNISQIEKMVERTLLQGDASPLFSNILPTVLGLFHQQDFLSELDAIDF